MRRPTREVGDVGAGAVERDAPGAIRQGQLVQQDGSGRLGDVHHAERVPRCVVVVGTDANVGVVPGNRDALDM